MADQAGGGGLAVGAGDADGAALAETARPAPLRRSRSTPRAAGGFERRQIGRHVGREHDQIARPRTPPASAARTECRSRSSIRAASGSSSSGFKSVARTARALARPAARPPPSPISSAPPPARFGPLSSITYLSFNVVSANSASTRPAIQKRAMIFDSVQPSASKWWCSGAILKIRLPPRSL